jgi:hypothetical protein
MGADGEDIGVTTLFGAEKAWSNFCSWRLRGEEWIEATQNNYPGDKTHIIWKLSYGVFPCLLLGLLVVTASNVFQRTLLSSVSTSSNH